MANNLDILDGNGDPQVVKTTDNAGVHTPHHNVDSSALPSGAATSAKQPALGTAGTASSDVISVQGIASMTPLLAAGNLADNAANSGWTNPVPAGANATTAGANLPTYSNNDVGVLQVGTRGALNMQLMTPNDQNPIATMATNADDVAESAGAYRLQTGAFNYVYDGSAWDRLRGTSADGMLVNLGGNNDVTVTGTVTANLAAGTNNIGDVDVLTVPADPFGANADAASATGSISAKLRFIAATGIPITGTVTVGSHAVTNAGTFAVQVDGAALTALQLIDDIVYTDDTSTHATGTSKGVLFMAAAVPTDTSVSANDIGAVAMTTDRKLHVAVMDALPAGSAAIGKLASNTGVTIGAVEIAAAQTLATVTTVSTVTAVTTLTGGGIAHDSADSGNPIKVGAKAITALSGATLVASADRADNQADLDGALLVRENGTLADYVNGNASNTDGASTQVLAAGAAGIKHYITDVIIANTSASNIIVELKDNTTVKATFPVPANGGVVHSFKTPLAGTAATAWNFDPSSAATTVYCTVAGFKSKI